MGDDFFGFDTKSKPTKTKINKEEYKKLKSFCTAKENISKVKKEPMEWENIFSNYLSWRRKRQPTPVLLPGKSHGQRSLVGYCPWGRKKSETTERLHFHF